MSIDTSEFVSYALHWGYLGIFVWFVSLDQLSIVPEEITLVVIGYLSASKVFNPVLAAIIATLAFITVDTAYFLLAKSGSAMIINHHKKSRWTKKYIEKMRTNMVRTLVTLCFIPRMRMFGPIIVGMLRLSYRKFIAVDSTTLLIFSLLYIFLGDIFHRSMHLLFREFQRAQHLIFIALCVVVTVLVFRSYTKRKRSGAID